MDAALEPTFPEFRQRLRMSGMVPVWRSIPLDSLNPVSAFYKLYNGKEIFLFESVVGGEAEARYSYLATDPFLHFEAVGNTVRVHSLRDDVSVELPKEDWEEDGRYCGQGSPLDALQSLMDLFPTQTQLSTPFEFTGGAVGYFGYDTVRFVEHLPDSPPDDRQLPDISLDFYDSVVVFDHVSRTVSVTAHVLRLDDSADDAAWEARYQSAGRRIDQIFARLAVPKEIPPADAPAGGVLSRGFDRSNFDPVTVPGAEDENLQDAATKFYEMVRRCKEYIAAGDIFQVVVSQRFETTTFASPISIYRALRLVNPSPYMFLLRTNGTCLVGSSPELMVRVKDRRITVRPLAGTRRRGKTAEEDAALAAELLKDEKERAEHIMLVDLGRNDVGRVSQYGSVSVDKCMEIERYSHVMHISSTVSGLLKPDCKPLDALRACLPAGTVSGAPKVRAMQIIDEMEPTRRGPYAGAVGYLAFNSNVETCLALRTMVISDRIRSNWDDDLERTQRPRRVHIQAGAGLVADSIPSHEYQETINKGKALLKAIEVAEGWRNPVKSTERTVLSCIRPTSEMHIGNYFGAVKNWVALQDRHRCLYGIVDLHAMARNYDPAQLRANSRSTFIDLLACGIDPQKSTLFIQSMVPEHSELCWILSCLCAYGDLSRMTQFKERARQVDAGEKPAEFMSAGLLLYPVLQAADILMYRASFVPVGKDQEQHLELTRGIARRFNQRFGVDFFPEPQPLFSETPRIMSLGQPENKMSISDTAGSEKNCIGLFEEEESIRRKIRGAVTGVTSGPMSAGVANLFEILRACDKLQTANEFQKEFEAGSIRYADLKDAVADALIELTSGLRKKRQDIEGDSQSVDRCLREMTGKARELACKTIEEVRQLTGLLSFPN